MAKAVTNPYNHVNKTTEHILLLFYFIYKTCTHILKCDSELFAQIRILWFTYSNLHTSAQSLKQISNIDRSNGRIVQNTAMKNKWYNYVVHYLCLVHYVCLAYGPLAMGMTSKCKFPGAFLGRFLFNEFEWNSHMVSAKITQGILLFGQYSGKVN